MNIKSWVFSKTRVLKSFISGLSAGVFFTIPVYMSGSGANAAPPEPLGWDNNVSSTWKLDDGVLHSRNGGTFTGMIDISGKGTGFTGTDVTVAGDTSGIRVSDKGHLELVGKIKITSIVPKDISPDSPEYNEGNYGAVHVDDATAVIGDGADISGSIAVAARNNATVTIGKNSKLSSTGGWFELVSGLYNIKNPALYLDGATVTVGAGTVINGDIRLEAGAELILNGEKDNKIMLNGSLALPVLTRSIGTINVVRGEYLSITGQRGIYSQNTGIWQIDLKNLTIRADEDAFYLVGNGNTATLTNVDVESTASYTKLKSAVYTSILTSLTINKGTIKSNYIGLEASSAVVKLDDVMINAFNGINLSGDKIDRMNATLRQTHVFASNAGIILNGATLDMFDSTVQGRRNGFKFFGGTTASTVNVVRSIVNSSGYGIFVNSGNLVQLNLDNSAIRDINTDYQQDSGLYKILNYSGNPCDPGQLDLVADNGSKLFGRGLIENSEKKNGKPVANVTLRNGSFWYVDGDSEVTNLVNNGSTVSFKENKFVMGDDKFVNMVVRNDYTGQDGIIVFNARLNTNNADSPHDHLLIQGDAYGVTNVGLRNRGGNGGETDSDNIVLITVNGRAENEGGTFKLKSDYTVDGVGAVQVGLYNYFLKHRTEQGVNEWYLVSDVADEDVPDPVYPDEPEDPIDPVDPVKPGNGGGKETGRVYGASIPLYDVYGQILQHLNGLSTLRERTSGRSYAGGDQNGVDGRAFWLRAEGATGHFNSAASKTGAGYDLDRVKTQMGLDVDLLETRNGVLVGGVYVQYGHGKADISSRYGNGEIKTDSYGFGSTLTWYEDNGFYIDGQAQAQWFDSSIYSRSRNGEKGFDRYAVTGNKGFGYALSLEGGRRITLSNGWSITPQAQLVYNHVDFDSFRDMIGLRVGSGDGGSLIGRAGTALEREARWQSAKGDERYLKVYGSGNFYHEFLDGTSVSIAFSDFRNKGQRGWAGVGAGTSYSWGDDKYAVYGEVNTRTAMEDFGKSYDVQGTVGLKVKF